MRVCFHDGRHQPVRGLRGAGGARLGRLPEPLRRHQPPRPDPRGRGRHPQPLQAGQAGRRDDALLRAVGRRAGGHPAPARLPATTPTSSPAPIAYYDRRTVARLDPQPAWSTPGCTPASTASSRGRSSSTSSTCDLARRARRHDPRGHPPRGAWSGRSTCSSAATPASRPGTRCCASIRVIPNELGSLAFQIRYRRHLVDIEVTTERAIVRVGMSDEAPLELEIEGNQCSLEPGRVLDVRLKS